MGDNVISALVKGLELKELIEDNIQLYKEKALKYANISIYFVLVFVFLIVFSIILILVGFTRYNDTIEQRKEIRRICRHQKVLNVSYYSELDCERKKTQKIAKDMIIAGISILLILGIIVFFGLFVVKKKFLKNNI